MGKILTFSVFDIFQEIYIDLCTFCSEIIRVSPKIRFCIAVPFELTSQF